MPEEIMIIFILYLVIGFYHVVTAFTKENVEQVMLLGMPKPIMIIAAFLLMLAWPYYLVRFFIRR